jgi:outer membrane receptor protein involved in Fe transport
LSRAHFSGQITGFFSLWHNIQADLISPDGLPFTDNIGRGTIYGIEANGRWRPSGPLTLEAAIFINHSALIDPAAGFADANERPLPNIAAVEGRASFDWKSPISDHLSFRLTGALRYVGRSKLGTTGPFDLKQGETVQVDLSTGLTGKDWAISLDAANLFDMSGNNFAYGNPFSAALGRQITPLRPRTIRIGIKVGF